MRDCTVLPWPQPHLFSDPIRPVIRKHVPLKCTCLLYIWKISGDLEGEESTLDKFSKIRCFGHHQWSPQRAKASLLVYALAPRALWTGEMKGYFPHLCVSIHLGGVPLWKQSVVKLDLWLLFLRNVEEREVTGLCFHIFLCFSSSFFSMMVCSKELNTPLCWGWKWAIFICWRALAV